MICLVQVDYSKFFSGNIVPIGLLHIGSALKNAGYPVKVFHCTEDEIETVAPKIVAEGPLWVGFSVMTGPQTMHSAWLSRKLKGLSHAPIVWGGVHPSLLPQQCLQEDYIDMVVIGEGEETALELTQRLESGKDFGGVLGLGYKLFEQKESRIIINQSRPFIENLDDERYALDFSLLDVPRYFIRGGRGKYQRMFSYKSSRGCPFNCGFCYNNEFNKRRWRAKSAERVIEDLSFLKKNYGIDAVDFYDDEFYINRQRALKILEHIDLPTKTDIRIDMITDDFAKRLREIKVFSLLVGIESGSERILKLINKGITVEQIKKGARILAENNIRVVYSAIAGIPTETAEELKATIDLLLWIQGIHKELVVTVGPYLPYPGSALYNWTLENGFVPPQKTEDWGNIDRWSKSLRLPWVKDETFFYIREYLKFFNYNVPLLNKIATWRLKSSQFAWPVDAALIRFLYEKGMNQDSLLGKMIRKVHGVVREV